MPSNNTPKTGGIAGSPRCERKTASVRHARLGGILDVLDLVELDILQLVADLLDAADVHGLDDVAGFRIDRDRAARAFPGHALGRRDQRVTVGLAAGLLQRLVDQMRAVVTADREEIRIAMEFVVE